MKNKVASIAKGYAIANGVAGVIIGLSLMGEYIAVVGLFVMLVVALASFFIYCIGEGIQLLQDIKDGTKETKVAVSSAAKAKVEEELPTI